MKKDKLDELFEVLVTYGQEQLHYQEAYYSYENEDLILSWKTGEDSGGTCWGGEAKYSPCNQKQPDFSILDDLLLELDPNFNLKNYKNLTQKITKEETSHREYYGNGTYYDQLVLNKNDFQNSLQESGYSIDAHLDRLIKSFEDKTYQLIESNKNSHSHKRYW